MSREWDWVYFSNDQFKIRGFDDTFIPQLQNVIKKRKERRKHYQMLLNIKEQQEQNKDENFDFVKKFVVKLQIIKDSDKIEKDKYKETHDIIRKCHLSSYQANILLENKSWWYLYETDSSFNLLPPFIRIILQTKSLRNPIDLATKWVMCYQNGVKEIINDDREGYSRRVMVLFTNNYIGIYITLESEYYIDIYNCNLINTLKLTTRFNKDAILKILKYSCVRYKIMSNYPNGCTHLTNDDSYIYCVSHCGEFQECPQSKIDGICCDKIEMSF